MLMLTVSISITNLSFVCKSNEKKRKFQTFIVFSDKNIFFFLIMKGFFCLFQNYVYLCRQIVNLSNLNEGMNTTLSLESILHMLSGLSLSNRQWLAEHLVEPEEQERARQLKSDEEFVREFLAMPRGNDMTAEEMKTMLRESHHFGLRDIKYKYADEE